MIIAIFPDDYYNNCSYAKFTNLGTFDNEFFNFVLTGDAMLFTRSSPGGGHKWVTDVGSLQSPPLFTAAHCCFKHQLVNPPARPVYDGSVKTWTFLVLLRGMRALSVCARQSYLGWKRTWTSNKHNELYFCVPTCSDIACMKHVNAMHIQVCFLSFQLRIGMSGCQDDKIRSDFSLPFDVGSWRAGRHHRFVTMGFSFLLI